MNCIHCLPSIHMWSEIKPAPKPKNHNAEYSQVHRFPALLPSAHCPWMASSHSWVSVTQEIIFYCQKSSQDPPASVTISCFNNGSENPEWITISFGVIILLGYHCQHCQRSKYWCDCHHCHHCQHFQHCQHCQQCQHCQHCQHCRHCLKLV